MSGTVVARSRGRARLRRRYLAAGVAEPRVGGKPDDFVAGSGIMADGFSRTACGAVSIFQQANRLKEVVSFRVLLQVGLQIST